MKKAFLTLVFAGLGGAMFAQTSTPATPAVIGILNFPHAVNDLDKTVAFYKDVIGLEFSRPPGEFPNPGVPSLINAPGAHLRLAMMKMPGSKYVLELTQFSGMDRHPAQPMHTDPGAADLELRVRDLDSVFAAVKKSGAPIITRGGAPVKLDKDGNARSVLVRDPDGFIVELLQVPVPADAPAGNVYSTGIGLTAKDLEATKKFYEEMFGFELKGDLKWSKNPAVTELIDAPKSAEYREINGVIPGTNSRITFYEWKGMKRTPFHLNVYDPGAPALVLQLNDLEGALTKLRAANTPVISKNGEIVQFGPTVRNIFVTDPNGVNLELFQNSAKR